ncbi:MAG: VWA domain-containing protein [Blastocatellia bacterium]
MRNFSLMTLAIGLSLVILFLADKPTHAQQSDRLRNPLTINTDLVVTWAQITDRNDGAAVKGLGIDDFLLLEEGKPQRIGFVKEGQPLSVVILVDAMACIVPIEREFRRSHEALRQLGDDAEIALMAFDSDVVLVQPLIRDQNVIAGRLANRLSFFHALNGPRKVPRPARDLPRAGEAIYQAARYLEKNASPGRRKIVVVISESVLSMARTHPHTAAEVEELLDKTGTTIYALLENSGIRSIYGSDEFNPVTWFRVRRDKQRRSSGGVLEHLVDLTGGHVLVSKNMAWLNLSTLTPNRKFGEEFDELFIKLTGLIGSSYTIGYYPENSDFDGRFRRINLELSGRGKTKAGKVHIKTRNGYRALRPSLPDTFETKN